VILITRLASKKESDKKSGKKGDIQKLLKEERKKSETYLEQYKYLKADFENYKKMTERDKIEIIKNANERLATDLLPIVDDMENAINKIKDEKIKKGIVIIHDNLLKILENNGVKQMETIGKKFDPYYHEVLIKEESDKEDGIIIEEIQKGYVLNNKVIRHSKVKISKKR